MTTTAEQSSLESTRSVEARRTWHAGGSLLLASTVTLLAARSFLEPISVVAEILFAAALLVFALGLGRGGSVTARRPLGTAAITGLAVWTVARDPLLDGLYGDQATLGYQIWIPYLGVAVSGALALIAVVQIARAGVVPAPWNLVPAWCLIALTASELIQLAVLDDDLLVPTVGVIHQVVQVSVPLLLAVLAIVLGSHAAPSRSVTMIDTTGQNSREPARFLEARRTWFAGGVLLLASIAMGALDAREFLFHPTGYLAVGLFAAALLVFAFGLGRGGSITARRPLGTAALAGLAIWTVVRGPLLEPLYTDQTIGSGYGLWIANLAVALSAALALVSVVQIARAGVVPAPWNRVPAWCLIAYAASHLMPWVIPQNQDLIAPVLAVQQAVQVSALLVLAVLAIVLGSHAAPSRSVATDRTTEQH